MAESRKGFQMSISAVIAIVVALLFVALFWMSFSGFFDKASNAALGMIG